MIPILFIILWLVVVFVNVLMARLHAHLVEVAIKENRKTAILHGAWAAAYVGLTMVPLFFHWNDLKWLNALNGVSYGLLHASVFPFWYNRYRHLPDFNLSTTSTSWYDRTLVRLGFKSAKVLMIGLLVIAVGLEIVFLFNV